MAFDLDDKSKGERTYACKVRVELLVIFISRFVLAAPTLLAVVI